MYWGAAWSERGPYRSRRVLESIIKLILEAFFGSVAHEIREAIEAPDTIEETQPLLESFDPGESDTLLDRFAFVREDGRVRPLDPFA